MNNKTKSFEIESLNNKGENSIGVFISRRLGCLDGENSIGVFISRRSGYLGDKKSQEVFISRRLGCWKCEKPAGGFQWQL